MRRCLALLAVLALGSGIRDARADVAAELRVATTGYRFGGISYSFEIGFVLEGLYIGVPERDELYLGAGFDLQPVAGLSLVPLAYAVVGNESGERGAMVGLSLSIERERWRLLGFGGRFFRIQGDVPSYTFLDSLALTRAIGRWEIGASGDVYESDDGVAWLVGPTTYRNDDRGAWGLSARMGSLIEVRLLRSILF